MGLHSVHRAKLRGILLARSSRPRGRLQEIGHPRASRKRRLADISPDLNQTVVMIRHNATGIGNQK